MRSFRLSALLLFAAACFITGCQQRQPAFLFDHNDQGVMLSEAGEPVFFYQKEPKSSDGRFICNNYIHPLYSIDGDTLTEEFPASHPHQRGIFWGWHQVYINDQSVGNSWAMNNITHEVSGIQAGTENNTARLDVDVMWRSAIWQNGEPFIHEQTSILVHQKVDNLRIIDFRISLTALVPGVNIGGSNNEAGYGGFSMRIKTPEDLVFTSVYGRQAPDRPRTKPSSWMDFSGTFGPESRSSSLTLLCHPSTINYPSTWLLNQRSSMQNPVFPGRHRTHLPPGIPVNLQYRLIVHNSDINDLDIAGLKAEYDQFLFPE